MVDFGLGMVDFGLGMVDFDVGMVDFRLGMVEFGSGMVDFRVGVVHFGLGIGGVALPGTRTAPTPPDPGSECDYDPRRALSPLPPASPLKILKLQRKFYKSKTYFGIFKVFTGFNLASSPIIFKLQRVNLTPANSLLMQRESFKKNKKYEQKYKN